MLGLSYIIRVLRAKWFFFKKNLKKKLVYRGFLSLCSVVKSGKAFVCLITDYFYAKIFLSGWLQNPLHFYILV